MTLILTNDEVRRVLTMKTCIEILEDAYREQAEGRAMNQLRHDTEMPVPEMPNDGRYEFKTMVGVLPKYGVSALRMSSSLVHHPVANGAKTCRKATRSSRWSMGWNGATFLYRHRRTAWRSCRMDIYNGQG